jgi:HEAT repeat protein
MTGRQSSAALTLAIILVGGAACAREGNAQAAGARIVRDDTASVARLLNAVRGSDPLLCELAVRDVDMHGSWSRWGPLGSSPIETDSTAAAMIRWIQGKHNDPAIIPRLRLAMRDGDTCVRRVGASFLGRMRHPTAVAALIEGAEDARPDTRYVAVIGLGLSRRRSRCS